MITRLVINPNSAGDGNYLIIFRRGTSAEWAANNPRLLNGEPAIDTDLKILKIGDGETLWANLESSAIGTLVDHMLAGDQFEEQE